MYLDMRDFLSEIAHRVNADEYRLRTYVHPYLDHRLPITHFDI